MKRKHTHGLPLAAFPKVHTPISPPGGGKSYVKSITFYPLNS